MWQWSREMAAIQWTAQGRIHPQIKVSKCTASKPLDIAFHGSVHDNNKEVNKRRNGYLRDVTTTLLNIILTD